MSPVYGGGPPGGGPPGPGSSTPIMPSPQDSNTSSGDMYPMMKPTSAMSGVSIIKIIASILTIISEEISRKRMLMYHFYSLGYV